MKTDNRRWIFPVALAALAAAYLIILFYRGFNDPDEGRYAEIPREMVANHNWLEMRMLGYRYYEKPPLAYWLTAPAIKFFGADEWAVRIPLLFSGLLGLYLLWRLASAGFGRKMGAAALPVMASTVGFVAGNGLLLTDSFLLTFFSATCIFLFLAFEQNVPRANRWTFVLLAAFAAALGFFTKGAVAVVLPICVLVVWILWEKRPQDLIMCLSSQPAAAACRHSDLETLNVQHPTSRFKRSELNVESSTLSVEGSNIWRTKNCRAPDFSVPTALLFGALLVLPLLWLIEKYNPDFIRHFIVEEHIARFQGTRAMQLHPEPCWFFLKVIPLLLLPWTFFIFRAVRTMWKQKVLAQDSFARFLLVWAVFVIGFFSASTGKLMSYILPALPPLGLLIGRWGVAQPVDQADKWDNRLWKTGLTGFWMVAVALVVIWPISFFRVWPEKIYQISGLSIFALLPLAAALLFFVFSKPRDAFGRILIFNSGILLTVALLLSPLAGREFNVLAHMNSSHVYKSLARQLKPDDKVIVFWSYRPALAFYAQRLYTPYQENNELAYGMKMEPERHMTLDNAEQLDDFLSKASGRVFALVEPQDLRKKFLSLNLRFRETALPRDPDTIVYELLCPRALFQEKAKPPEERKPRMLF